MGDAGAPGNVVLSRPFQFAEIPFAVSAIVDRRLVWTPRLPKVPEPIRSRWIYAFEFGERDIDQKPILVAEYHADKDGALGMVSGAKRRLVDATEDSAPHPTAVKSVALPVARQTKRLRHAFVATRGRLGKAAIWDIENGLDHLYQRLNLADDYNFKPADGDPERRAFVPVIDVLTLGENLSIAYKQALNDAINFVVAHKENPKKDEVEIRSRKFQLAKMIKDTLLAPEGTVTDPMGLYDYLAENGNPLFSFVDEYESTVRKLQWRRRNAARELIRLIDSSVWIGAFNWYLGTENAANNIGHFWVDVSLRCLDRITETPEGLHLVDKLMADREKGLLSFVFAPEDDASEELKERYDKIFPIVRKIATAFVVGFAEMAPALIVHRKVKAANKQIQATLRAVLVRTDVSIVMRAPAGRVTGALHVSTKTVHIDIDYKQAKVDLDKWLEDGKPHWPEGTKQAHVAEVLGHLFIGVEALNLCNALEDFRKGKIKSVEVMGAVLDLIVASEDPIRAFAARLGKKQVGQEAAEAAGAEALHAEGMAGAKGAIAEAAEKEAKTIFEKLAAPAAFKILGAASAAIDLYVNISEALEAKEKGDAGQLVGRTIVAGGSLLLLGASIANAAGYIVQSVALTAAAASLLVVGILIVVAGIVLSAIFNKSTWQIFARHCCFGDQPAKAGHENWSGGNFSGWTETQDGLDRQIEVFTAMLCAFQLAGIGFDAQTITVTFGAIPPKATLKIGFSIEYENGQKLTPIFKINLESTAVHCEGQQVPIARYEPYQNEGRLQSILLGVGRTANFEHARVRRSSCWAFIQYGEETPVPAGSMKPARNLVENAATGRIPIAGRFDYLIFDGSGMAQFRQMSSLDIKPIKDIEEGSAHEREKPDD